MSEQNQNKENSGTLFKNSNKTSEKHPDYTGTVNVNGKEFRLAAWENESKDKKTKFLKISVTDPENFSKKEDKGGQASTQSTKNEQQGNDIYGDIFDQL